MDNFFDKYIGTPYREYDEKGNFVGCMEPAYLLYPNAFRFKETDNFYNDKYVLTNMLKYCDKLEYASNFGDVVIMKSFGEYHFFVYVENNKYVHMNINHGLQYTDINDGIKRRTIGIYRYKGE